MGIFSPPGVNHILNEGGGIIYILTERSHVNPPPS